MVFFTPRQQKWLDSLPKRASSAAMILENEAGQVLLVKANYKPYWTFPGGVIDPDETPKDAALRETLEEVGIDIHPDTVEFVAVVNRSSRITQTYQFIFKAPLGVSMLDDVILQAAEIDEYALVSKDDVRSANRTYSQASIWWSQGKRGYIEQEFNEMDQ